MIHGDKKDIPTHIHRGPTQPRSISSRQNIAISQSKRPVHLSTAPWEDEADDA